MNEPQFFLQRSKKHLGEVALMAQFMYTFEKEEVKDQALNLAIKYD